MNVDCWQVFGFVDDQSISVRVFVALYDYDPFQSSPNDQPDTELPLSAGQRVFIIGDIDEVSQYADIVWKFFRYWPKVTHLFPLCASFDGFLLVLPQL